MVFRAGSTVFVQYSGLATALVFLSMNSGQNEMYHVILISCMDGMSTAYRYVFVEHVDSV